LKPTHLGLAPRFTAGQRRGVGLAASATILVLEENAAVQELIDQALHEAGHRVLSTNNALEAFEVVRRVRVDVLVAGVLIEERSQALVRELRSIQPELPIVCIACPDDDLPPIDGTARLSSPFSLDDLHQAIVSSLGRRREE
jgi:DNA-binding NtrC family response regulator